jgi:hypothetical protein
MMEGWKVRRIRVSLRLSAYVGDDEAPGARPSAQHRTTAERGSLCEVFGLSVSGTSELFFSTS